MVLKKIAIGLGLGWMLSIPAYGQYTHGTTGLLNMPSADMQKGTTAMIGGGYLGKHTTPYRWNYNTWNYYINLTIFSWVEVSYTCTIFDEMIRRGNTPIHLKNQDRNFSVRFRAWKEGWWKPWTPQLVLGVNDITTGSGGDYLQMQVNGKGNGYYNRYFVAMTKHFPIRSAGELGIHAAYVFNKRKDYKLKGFGLGMNFRFGLNGDDFWTKALNGLNLMAEAYPANDQGARKTTSFEGKVPYSRGLHVGRYDLNAGFGYSLWKDRINIYSHLYGCKDFSVGLQLKMCLE